MPDQTSRAATRLGRPEFAPVVEELARRFGNGDLPATLTLRDLPVPTRRAVADLLGADRLPGAALRLPVGRLQSALGVPSLAELRDLVAVLRGPLPDRRAERRAGAATRARLWAWLDAEVAGLRLADDSATLVGWVESLRAAGIRGGVEAYRCRLEQVLAVLRALPADGGSLAALAADRTGDPHALDHGRPVGVLVLDLLARTADVPRAEDAEAARLLWERFGVAPDALSSTVLTLGLPGAGGSPLAAWLAAATAVGEPVVLTLADLRRWPVAPLDPGEHVYVVENPSLVAEAAARGWAGRPALVCSSGRPTVAVVTLLRQLTAAGAVAYQHADFDAAGLAITGWLRQRACTVPWRMDAADYLEAVAGVAEREGRRAGEKIAGGIPPTPWDPLLALTFDRIRVPAYEEAIRSALLDAMA